MNLVEQLMSSDSAKADEKNKAIFKSTRLQKILGAEEPVDIEIEQVSLRRIQDIMTLAVKQNGTVDFSKSIDCQVKVCMIGITNIPFKDEQLQMKFGCKTAPDLCEKLLGNELPTISEVVQDVSGYQKPEEDSESIETIKNL